jgi:hypothetical protein
MAKHEHRCNISTVRSITVYPPPSQVKQEEREWARAMWLMRKSKPVIFIAIVAIMVAIADHG